MDADFAGDEGTRKSTNKHCMMLHDGIGSWLSKLKLQSTVALSTAEAETILGPEWCWLSLWIQNQGWRELEIDVKCLDHFWDAD
jgi:hypothetical protein